MPSVFSDHMVVQRDLPVVVWGKATPGGRVTVTMGQASRSAVAKSDSHWTVEMPALAAGGPFKIAVAGLHTIEYADVLAGDVWICSGQSNMEWNIARTNNSDEEIASANWDQIRLFDVAHTVATRPQWNASVKSWEPVTPDNIAAFSAVGYLFGREIHKEVGVPIGLVSTNWGGTRAEAWTSGSGLKPFPQFSETVKSLEAFDEAEQYMSVEQATYDSLFVQWEQKLFASESGMQDGEALFAASTVDDDDWSTMDLPQPWEGAGLPGYDGIVYFRRTFDVPNWVTGEQMLLYLGQIDDQDQTWINGVKIGETDQYAVSRIYQVASDILKPGENVLAVRVTDTGGGGGFMGTDAEMRIEAAGPSRIMPILLAGDWKYQPAVDMGEMPPPPVVPRIQDLPSVLYNGMIAPLTPMRIKGAIWYQGESNADRAFEYRTLFSDMIKDWRAQWNQPEFPFFFVQLANFMAPQTDPGEESAWAELREAQTLALNLENTGMAVIIDIGEADDIHPRNKQDVGGRLAQSALAVAYGQEVVESGPLYSSMVVEGSSARLSFDFVGEGLSVKGDNLKGFVVAGSDKKFVWADAVIDGDQVVVSSSAVETPVAVRYGWADNPEVNLYNVSGLPASPFRTDDWPGVTWPG